MKRKEKLKEIKLKIIELEGKSLIYKQGKISKEDYESFLKEEITYLKEQKIKELKNEIEKGLKEIKFLKQIKHKIENNQILDDNEKLYILSL
ncbi:hypothetical protein ACQY1Q_10755 [Tenacibaculum sp. TC6]|uniref:hypothetical protein n=1 Tax=Tenacibaculum sp. TC6 TaxID=3423223 RepID=UPI003D3607E9